MGDEGGGGAVVPEAIRIGLEIHLAEALQGGTPVSVGRIVLALQSRFPDSGFSPVRLAEVVLREASARGLVIMIG